MYRGQSDSTYNKHFKSNKKCSYEMYSGESHKLMLLVFLGGRGNKMNFEKNDFLSIKNML